ncbi:5-(carboxyamino)imidazole ribonucleotide synthase [Flavimarina sp. Hel_I_48]|uniref:5-(carboxyamino)imidazole ribonucleotide synthase n=1 Tax=Flavimarina sp. Hel_I_48 TaxID=1392488 RepID=UPI0004DF6B1D|nr:5-(carboxyamino)imidazole ribonucleotide synthase [Flavimarina sp. Hel_I_48]
MRHYFSTDFKLGILGGGQLGKMLLQETRKFDIQTHVLDPSAEAPSRFACNHFEQGSLQDFDTVYNFGKKVDVLTFEIETINVDALEKLQAEGVTVYPSPQTLRVIQDKGIQKNFYTEKNIPTSPFSVYNDLKALKKDIKSRKIELPFVWKSTQGGYDGKGVKIVRKETDLQELPDTVCLAENLISFKNELAVIVVRNAEGQVKTYPVVEMEFHPEANQVEYVICPARISDKVAKRAREVAKNVSEAFEHVGLLAVELFQTEENEILVNEVAPRPHNSGHYSIEGSFTSQFENHLRAILNLPLGNTDSKVGAVMVNLVGAENHEGQVEYKHIAEILAMNGVTPHIYGKKITRPFRKMGHVTIINKDLSEARKIAEKVKGTIKVVSSP